MRFKQQHAFEKRKNIAENIRRKYSDRVPIVVEPAAGKGSNDLPPLNKQKFLVPADITVGKFVYQIRKQIMLRPETALFLFVGNGVLPPTAALIGQLDERFRDADGMLYITIASESTFGCRLRAAAATTDSQ